MKLIVLMLISLVGIYSSAQAYDCYEDVYCGQYGYCADRLEVRIDFEFRDDNCSSSYRYDERQNMREALQCIYTYALEYEYPIATAGAISMALSQSGLPLVVNALKEALYRVTYLYASYFTYLPNGKRVIVRDPQQTAYLVFNEYEEIIDDLLYASYRR